MPLFILWDINKFELKVQDILGYKKRNRTKVSKFRQTVSYLQRHGRIAFVKEDNL